MRQIFFWMEEPPDPANIVLEDWDRFLELMARATSLVVLSLVIIIVFAVYFPRAHGRRIHAETDLFEPYTPMHCLWLSLIGGLTVGGMCAWRYSDYLGGDAGGLPGVVVQMGVSAALSIVIISVACFVVPGITPARFKYRPFAVFMSHRGVKAGRRHDTSSAGGSAD
jgi:hypothetical protein